MKLTASGVQANICETEEKLFFIRPNNFKKTWAGLTSRQVKVTQVMDVLDNECITFRTESRHKRNQKTRKAK